MILCQKDATVHSPSYCILLPERAFRDKKSDDIIYFFAAGDVSRETSLAAKSEEKRMFSQATLLVTRVQFYPFTGICPAFAKWSDTFETKAYFLVVSFSNKNLHATMFSFEVVRNIRKPSGKCFSRALIGYSNLGYPVLFSSPSDPKLATDKWLPGLLPYIK